MMRPWAFLILKRARRAVDCSVLPMSMKRLGYCVSGEKRPSVMMAGLSDCTRTDLPFRPQILSQPVCSQPFMVRTALMVIFEAAEVEPIIKE